MEKKRQILEIIEEQLFEAEEDLIEQDPQVSVEIQEHGRPIRMAIIKLSESMLLHDLEKLQEL